MTSKIAVALLSAALIGTPAVVFAQTTIQQDVQKRKQDNRTIDTQKNSAEGAGSQSGTTGSSSTGAAGGSNAGAGSAGAAGTAGAAGSGAGSGNAGAGGSSGN